MEYSTPVGTDVLTAIKELSNAGYLDFWLEPAEYTLRIWVKGRKGGPRDVSLYAVTDPLDPTSGNVRNLNHHRVTG